ncbi:MAG: hypothetical protein A2942_00200 [Candidatus Lloydbacteria bacterium RIFCSPLOWO2_01_FULL_50_20]|uniref:Uncharacterized protein n=1 Tax=Candidatus Lloydbacteria bacterium RIFCSPLOWO2_01_FULL_50_20 TaxID=1798665 RepID=A0A1G2DFY9_9BACT|nr:MAG: hypothetical protein A3C13_03740 [Candidatus Lloydbacteria bacterium RIFCSPHIGHO2_02_FULL_50_11]OGZ12519.1 MAG: hypothetical protein A2942_00200 [Candidatus Lloydbacteria bacterium RIFCSPLOWO2_01_FULL_50_20]
MRVLPIIPPFIPGVDDIGIAEIPCADPTNEKGLLTWVHPLGTMRSGSLATFARTPDHEVGGHWHEEIPNKNPEKFILLDGTMVFTFEDAYGARRIERFEANALGRKILLTIPPFIIHWVKIESPVALYQEIQQEPFRLTDNWSEADWIRLKELVLRTRVKP